jgi:cell division septation protein DedD
MAKELKPKLILAESSGGRGAFRSLLLLSVVFVLGVFVGMKVDDLNLSAPEFVGEKGSEVISSQTSPEMDKKPDREKEQVLDGSQTAEVRPGLNEESAVNNEKNEAVTTVPTNAPSPPSSANSKDTEGLKSISEPEFNEGSGQANKDEHGNANEENEYTLQVAAFKKMDRAQKVVDELKGKGYDAYIVPADNSREENWNLVRIGKFKTKEEAGNFATVFKETEGMAAILKEANYGH